MEMIFLGTSGYHPTESRHTAGVFFPDAGLLLDAGTGTFRLRNHLRTDVLDVYLSHAHLDHVVGLTYLLIPLGKKQLRSIRVHGSESTLEAVREHLFSDGLFPVLPVEMTWHVLTEEERPNSQVCITHCPLTHPGGCIAYRVALRRSEDAEITVAYVTDTLADGRYDALIQDVDVLIHECHFADDQADWAALTGHSHTSQVARLAAAANVGQLILTHFNPDTDSQDPCDIAVAHGLFPRTRIAHDGLILSLPLEP